MWQQLLDRQFILPFPISQIIAWQTLTLPNSIVAHENDSTHAECLMKCVCDFKDPPDRIGQIIVIMQKWYTIFHFLIQDHLVPYRGSTRTALLCMIVITISSISYQTSVNHQFYSIYHHVDISIKSRNRFRPMEILNQITDPILCLQAASQAP
jgi:hypothetical protein